VTPDGRHAISASDDGTLKVWDLACREELRTGSWLLRMMRALLGSRQTRQERTLRGDSIRVQAVAVTPDGRHAISACGTVVVWDLASGTELRTLRGHTGLVCSVAVTPDGRQVISASADHTLKVWDLASGIELRTLHLRHTGLVCSVAVTPDGRQVISASADHTLKVWDLASGIELRTIRAHTGPVNAVTAMSDGRHAVSASGDHTLKVWDLAIGAELATFTGNAAMLCCAVAPDGRTIVAGDAFGAVHFLRPMAFAKQCAE
jgi:WD40 repeat protein